jgi:hypothetical protein
MNPGSAIFDVDKNVIDIEGYSWVNIAPVVPIIMRF